MTCNHLFAVPVCRLRSRPITKIVRMTLLYQFLIYVTFLRFKKLFKNTNSANLELHGIILWLEQFVVLNEDFGRWQDLFKTVINRETPNKFSIHGKLYDEHLFPFSSHNKECAYDITLPIFN